MVDLITARCPRCFIGACAASTYVSKIIDDRIRVPVKALILMVCWCILLVLCWPAALLVLVLAPVLWLLCLPLRLVGLCVEAVLALLRALLFLPARLLGHRRA